MSASHPLSHNNVSKMMGYVLKKKINPEEDSRCGQVLLQSPTAISFGGSRHGNSRGSLLGPKTCSEHLTPINKWTFQIVSAGIALSASLPLRELRSPQLKWLTKWWHWGEGCQTRPCGFCSALYPRACIIVLFHILTSPNVSMETLDLRFYVTSVIRYCYN